MEQLIKAATAKIGDKEQAKRINALLTESVADVLKSRGWGSHGIQRKGVPGFEREDLVKVLYDYKAGLTGWLSKMEAARDFSEALRDIDAKQTKRLWERASRRTKRGSSRTCSPTKPSRPTIWTRCAGSFAGRARISGTRSPRRLGQGVGKPVAFDFLP